MSLSILLKRGLTLFLFLFAITSFAQVKLPTVFSDNMVLQYGKPVKIWGIAGAGEEVAISFGKQKKQTKASTDGHWQIIFSV